MQLTLASASPRRAELLTAAGIGFDVIPANVDESILPGESPEAYVRRLAEAKASTVAPRVQERAVLAADTVVLVDSVILGKPVDDNDAWRMLRLLSGRTHEVMTGVCLSWVANSVASPGAPKTTWSTGGREARHYEVEVAVTAVEFAVLSDEDIYWYVASGEPANKAGAYGIQGLAGRFVTRIDGSYSNVVGLPVAIAWKLCRRAGLLVS